MSAPGDSTRCLSHSGPVVDPEPEERLAVAIVHEDADWSAFERPEDAVRAAIDALVSKAGSELVARSEVGIVLADDATLQKLNATYRGKDLATNVLSFPFQPPPGAEIDGPSYLGDVVLAAQTIVREARERYIAPIAHLQHLAVHGVLHLLGYDHDDEASAERMERLETEILATLGVADPHAHPAVQA